MMKKHKRAATEIFGPHCSHLGNPGVALGASGRATAARGRLIYDPLSFARVFTDFMELRSITEARLASVFLGRIS